MTETVNDYPQIPIDQLPDDLRSDITWAAPWVQQKYQDGRRRVDWCRYGRDADDAPVFSQLILWDGRRAGWQEGRRLIDEQQMGVSILSHFGIEVDQPALI